MRFLLKLAVLCEPEFPATAILALSFELVRQMSAPDFDLNSTCIEPAVNMAH